MKIIVPIILIVISGGIYLWYIDGAYDEVQALQIKEEQYDRALERARDLNAIHDRLLTIYNGIETQDLARLEKLLPESIDSIRLLIDIDGIAAENGLVLSGLSATPEQISDGRGEIGTVNVNFSTTARYTTFKNFMRDLEDSLRIFDITSLSFTVSESAGEVFSYSVSLETYWMNR